MEHRETRPGNLYEDEIFIRKGRAREVHQLTVLHVHVWMWALMERNRRLGVEVGTALLEAGSTVPRPTTICGRIGGQDTGTASIGSPYMQNEVQDEGLTILDPKDATPPTSTPQTLSSSMKLRRDAFPKPRIANGGHSFKLPVLVTRTSAHVLGAKKLHRPISYVGQIFTYLHPRRDQHPQRTQQQVSARKPDSRAPASTLTGARTSKSA